ncbi:thioesterase family protein [Parvibaculaceae bacterium PLY_AMNH_Bact1]|nr:thioesterase family protein [Parvibaculaceae bacterium PLY_AMNH_Bact1]
MTEPIQTVQSIVNTWNCDEVGHMNVQFYVAAASDANRAFAVSHGQTGPVISSRDHIRFHRELRAGDIFAVMSGTSGTHEGRLILSHELRNSATGVLAATLTSRTDLPADLDAGPYARPSDLALPRGVPGASSLPHLQLDDQAASSLIPIYQGVVHPEHCDETGLMRQQHIMGRFSDGAAHLWQHVGFDRDTMIKARRGTVVLEMRLDRLTDVRAGTVLVGKSAMVEVMGRVLRFAHFLFDASTGALMATGEAAAVMLDLDARKTVAFSDEENARLTPYLMKVT